MNTNYHTVDPVPQSCTECLGNSRRSTTVFVAAAHATKPLRIRQISISAHPVLFGDREILRQLRAAEMAAWEAVRPNTTIHRTDPVPNRQMLWRLGVSRPAWLEIVSFFLLAICGGAALFAGLGDVSELLTRWSVFRQGIETLLR